METEKVSYIVFEGEMTRLERMNHRLWIMCICMLIALLGTNAGWMWYESQWQVVEESTVQEVTQSAESSEGDAINRFIGGDYGESNTDDQSDQDNQK